MSRCERFKSSGKLINVEHDGLMEPILSYYHTQWPLPQEQHWLSRRNKMITYLESAEEKGDERDMQVKRITSPKGKYILKYMVTNDELYGVHHRFSGVAKDNFTVSTSCLRTHREALMHRPHIEVGMKTQPGRQP